MTPITELNEHNTTETSEASGVATEHIAAEAEASMSMDDIVTELSAHSTDDARDIVNAAQTILTGKQDDIRNLCKPWGVQLKVQKRYRPTETIKQEHKISWTKRAMKLKSRTDASTGGAATEHAETELCVDDAFAETLRGLQAISTQTPILIRVIAHACSSE